MIHSAMHLAFATREPFRPSLSKTAQSRRKSVAATQGILQPGEGHCSCGGGCPECVRHASPEPRLLIGRPNDPSEFEADRIANSVVAARDGKRVATQSEIT